MTVTDAPDKLPGIHEYVVAPDAVNIELLPGQTEVGDAVAVTFKAEFTVTVTVVLPVQPFVFPVTV